MKSAILLSDFPLENAPQRHQNFALGAINQQKKSLKLLTFQLGKLCVTLLIEMVAKIVSGGPVDMALLLVTLKLSLSAIF